MNLGIPLKEATRENKGEQGYPFFVVYFSRVPFSRGTLPKKNVKGYYWGT